MTDAPAKFTAFFDQFAVSGGSPAQSGSNSGDGPRGCIGEAQMREPIDKVLATHIQRQAGHLKLTTDDSERLKAMLAHIGTQDHILTTYAETEKGQWLATNANSLQHMSEKLCATLCQRDLMQLELHNCRARQQRQ